MTNPLEILLGLPVSEEKIQETEIKPEKISKPNVFDFMNDLSKEKKNLLGKDFEMYEKFYNQFMINKGFSYHPDTILHAAEMNLRQNVSVSMHNKYFLEAIKPRKRYSKWFKPEKDADLDLVQSYYKCGRREAQDYVKILSIEEINSIKKEMNKGGA